MLLAPSSERPLSLLSLIDEGFIFLLPDAAAAFVLLQSACGFLLRLSADIASFHYCGRGAGQARRGEMERTKKERLQEASGMARGRLPPRPPKRRPSVVRGQKVKRQK